MLITFVIDQYGEANNGTTITARRMAEALRQRGHTVKIITAKSTNEKDVYSTGVRYVPILYEVSKTQGMCFAKPNKTILRKVINSSDIVHFLLPFKLAKVGKKIADELNIPSTAAFHLQPENITSTIYLNRFKPLNQFIYHYFKAFIINFNTFIVPVK